MMVRPGACMNRDSTVLECSSAAPLEAPDAFRITSGSRYFGPCIYLHLETRWKISVNAGIVKSEYISSATGRSPVSAAPMAAPMMAVSTIGVFRTRSGPNSSSRPRVSPKIFPNSATSSPQISTFSSLCISSRRAAVMAFPYVYFIVSSCFDYT